MGRWRPWTALQQHNFLEYAPPPWPPTSTHTKTLPPSNAHDIIQRESPIACTFYLYHSCIFLRLVCRRRAAYASSSFARLTALPSTSYSYVGHLKQQRVELAVETTLPECLFDHSTIFDYSFIFPAAGSLSVVYLSSSCNDSIIPQQSTTFGGRIKQ